jgi:PmbA protein
LHAGVNPISGDFSVKANGFYIENGKINRPVTLIVVSGNFLEMMNNVIEVGSDLEVTTRSVFAPSILFDDLQISGE